MKASLARGIRQSAAVVTLCAGAVRSASAVEPQRAFAESEASLLEQRLETMRTSIEAIGATIPEFFTALGRAQFAAPAGGPRSATGFIVALVVTLAAMAGLVALTRLATAGMRARLAVPPAEGRIGGRAALLVLGLELVDRIVAVLVAVVGVRLLFPPVTHQGRLAAAILGPSAARFWIAMLVVGAILRPGLAALRLVALDDATARRLHRCAGAIIAAGVLTMATLPVLIQAGAPVPAVQLLALLIGLAVAGGTALELLRMQPPLAPRWRIGVLVVVGLLWLAWTVGVLLVDLAAFDALVGTAIVVVLAYLADALLGLSSQRTLAGALRRTVRVVSVLAIGWIVIETWLVGQLELIGPEMWRAARRSFITAGSVVLFGFVAWEALRHWIDHKVGAVRGPAMPGEDDEQASPASRLTTLMPLFRVLIAVSILVLTVLVALSELGVNTAPLIAGASIFGLAISFGSQALVRDIVSGIFFIADDAFRIGEYIDTGRLKGTVEAISIRSIKLRHQNGQVHTIPFGQLGSITNFSRDWATMKFNIRLVRDVDVELVRKTVKKIGQEMMEDPELKAELIQPLKMQGVADIAENALVVRLKFTARPIKPTWVQRQALKRIVKTFADKGIEFASNAVTVQGAGSTPAAAAAAASTAIAALPPEQRTV